MEDMFSAQLMSYMISVMKEICFGGSGNKIFESITQRWQQLGEWKNLLRIGYTCTALGCNMQRYPCWFQRAV